MTNKILVVDLEATCWEEDGPYQKLHSEIIEIGICILDTSTGSIAGQRGILVKPVHSSISTFCTNLTSITPELVAAEGVSLAEAMHTLKDEYHATQLTWASYGAYDHHFLREQCAKQEIDYCMADEHINIKVLLSQAINIKKGLGMKRALKHLNIPLDGTHHRGVSDAYNSAKILWWILNNKQA
ncbi:MAG: hypothetical protein RL660_1721 [Bacteroidota bacterium]|jgi:inhibitor of KinA sporulation pathway (predicted exonuclease)